LGLGIVLESATFLGLLGCESIFVVAVVVVNEVIVTLLLDIGDISAICAIGESEVLLSTPTRTVEMTRAGTDTKRQFTA
jgi:hypothetical protein